MPVLPTMIAYDRRRKGWRANGDNLNASCQDRSAPGGSSDRVDHGFSIRGRTHRHRQTARWRFRDRSHHQAVRRARATPGLADLGEPSAALRDWDRGCGRPSHARAGSRRSPDFEELVERQKDCGRFDAGVVDVDAKHGATMGDEVFRAISRDARTERNRRKLETWTGEVSWKSRQGDHAWQGVRRP